MKRYSRLSWSGIGLVALACPAASAETRPVMIGYMPVSAGLEALPSPTNLGRYTHVMLAFANPDSSGTFVSGDAMTCMPGPRGAATGRVELKAAVAAIHRAGAKALISIGGGGVPGCAGDWAALLRPQSRDRVAGELVALVDEVAADGIDVDIEGALLTRIDLAGDYTPFIDALSAGLPRHGKLLTCATASYESGMVPRASLRRFDLVSIMSYDQIGPGWGQPGDEHSTYAKAVGDVTLWRRRGVPRDRLVLGLPYYGYGYGTYAATYAYRDVVATFGAAAAAADVIGSRCAGCSYITHNGPATLARKALLARQRAAGVMVWNIVQDTDDGRLGQTVAAALRAGRDD